MATLFADGHQPSVLHVGNSFAIAAAAGGLAHILHNYDPPRLRAGIGGSEGFSATFESTLPYELVLGIKQRGANEQQIKVLDPSEPFVDEGGRRPVENSPALAVGSRPRMRLIPGGAAGILARRGRNFEPMRVLESPGKMEIEWNPTKQQARVHSKQIEGTDILFIDASTLRKRQEASLDPFDGDMPPGALAVDAAEDVILDLGMSKIVAVTADRGWVSAAELERLSDRQPVIKDGSLGKPKLKAPHSLEPPMEVEASPNSETTTESKVEILVESSIKELPKHRETPYENDQSSDLDFARKLEDVRDFFRDNGYNTNFEDIVVTLIAMAVRPIVILSGPPGCGKSTLVRIIAHILGNIDAGTYHEVPVQAHWEDDSALFGDHGLLLQLLENEIAPHLVLFDEFNLTRPEYYMSRIFHALNGGGGAIASESNLSSCRVLGTMNIDEASRPPSPKVIDRCFLLELEQVSWTLKRPTGLYDLASAPRLSGLPSISIEGEEWDERIGTILETLQLSVQEHDLRQDLLPSRRVLSDIKSMIGLHHKLDLQAKALLSRDELVDRVIASRILVKLSGAFDQLQPALHALDKLVDGMEELRRTRQRLKLALRQARLGFVSPWQ